MKNKILNPVCWAFLALIATACTKEIPVVAITEVALSQTSLFINVGSTDSLKAIISPSDATNTTINWVSDDAAIATVSADGVVAAVAPGIVTITATTADGKLTAMCAINSVKWTFYNKANGLGDNIVNCIGADAQGNIWCGGYPTSRFDGTSWTYYLPDSRVYAIAFDGLGNKWFGTLVNGVSKFDGTNWTTYKTTNSGLGDNSIDAIAAEANGNTWFSTSSWNPSLGTGLSKFDGTNWTTYTSASTNNGLINNVIRSIAIDKQGNKWFATNQGISKFDGTSWTSYTVANTGNQLVDHPYSIVFDAQGNVWFATGLGLLKFDGTNWTTYVNPTGGLSWNCINAMAIDAAGNKWLATESGVAKFDGTNWTNYNNKGLVYSVRCIAIDLQGNKWLGTTYGVFKFQN